MFVEGNILFFDPFFFKNGSTAKAKFFVVLKLVDENIILASLPSSQDYSPAIAADQSGCIELPEANFNCFRFIANQSVTQNGWAFSKDTFLYGHQLDEYQKDNLQDIYPIEGIDYEIIGQLNKSVLDAIIDCFRNSASVKRKFKRLF